VDDTISFTAIGDDMNITPTENALRYVPVSWKVNPHGSWESAPYTASFRIASAGDYTLYVTYMEQEYWNGKWNNTGRTDVASVAFTVMDKPAEPTAEPTATPTAEPEATASPAPTVAPTSAPTAAPTMAPPQVTAVPTAAPEIETIPTYPIDKSPQTGQEDMMLLWCGMALIAAGSLAGYVFVRRKRR